MQLKVKGERTSLEQTLANRGYDSIILDEASSTRLSPKLSHKVDALNLRYSGMRRRMS